MRINPKLSRSDIAKASARDLLEHTLYFACAADERAKPPRWAILGLQYCLIELLRRMDARLDPSEITRMSDTVLF
jgi:hypothetical protein